MASLRRSPRPGRGSWPPTARLVPRLIGVLLVLAGLVGLAAPVAAAPTGPVHVIDVSGEIDLGLSPYVRRSLRAAGEDGASAAVLVINTPGGRLDAALDIKNALLDSDVRTIAYVNREALSAGALIALSTREIYMAPGGVLGAATPIEGDTGQTASEKVISAVRKEFRAVAEVRGLDPAIAEAMVDPDVEVPGVVEKGKLLTLTSQEALRLGYSRGEAPTLDALLGQLGLSGNAQVSTSPGWAEGIVRFVTNPVVAALLIAIGFLGIIIEVQTPGFGVAGIIGILALALFFWGHMLAGLAGWEGVALIVLGLAFLGAEIFLIPGFGITGIIGIGLLVAGLFISLVGRIPSFNDYERAIYVIAAAIVLVLAGFFAVIKFFPTRHAYGGLVLQERLPSVMRPRRPEPTESNVPEGPSGTWKPMTGARGTALTPLRPAGTAMIDGKRVDVVTDGEFVPAGAVIEIIVDEDYRKVVRAVRAKHGQETAGGESAKS